MGIAGTEVAKEASDIILMDDNFASIVKAVLWGRCVYDAIRKFLQFQLSVNVSAVVITIVTSIYTTVQGPKKPESVLTAVQLLWVNLIMDTMAALALATDDPTPELLKRKPSKRTDPIVNADMFKQILGQAFYQIIVCLVLYFKTPEWFPDGRKGEEVPASGFVGATVVFNTFIFCQLFNEINSRSISRELNVFHRLLENKIFMFIFFISALFQALIVQFGGVVFTIDPNGLSWSHWLISIALGMGSLVVGFVIRLLPEFPIPRYLLPGSEPEIQQPALSNPSEAKPVVVVIGESRDTLTEKEEVVPQTTEESLAAARWKDAIHKTRVQVKVVKIFTLPLRTDPSVKPPSIRARIDAERNEKRSSTENWNTLRLYIQTASVFRRRADPSSSQLVDPRVVRNAMVNAARKRNQQQ
ncbi:hypothetical protein BC833DRAFT_612976 [Globomyces pollinis-pini]|nr:hypothetical protein BC833DRAFT_612976 [Globomyces pollinis-pini]